MSIFRFVKSKINSHSRYLVRPWYTMIPELNPTAEDHSELRLIFLWDLDVQGWAAHSNSMR